MNKTLLRTPTGSRWASWYGDILEKNERLPRERSWLLILMDSLYTEKRWGQTAHFELFVLPGFPDNDTLLRYQTLSLQMMPF